MLNMYILFLLVMPVFSLYPGDSCVLNEKQGTCERLVECEHFVKELQEAGAPIPSSIRKRLLAAGCGFASSHPLVCCVPQSTLLLPITKDILDKRRLSTNQNSGSLNSMGPNLPHTMGPGVSLNSNHDSSNDWNHHSGNANYGGTWGSHHGGSGSNGWENKETSNTGDHSCEKDRHKPAYTTTTDTTNNWDKDTDRRDPPNIQGHRNLRVLPTDCGMIEDDRIWGGNRTGLYELPWMVLIAYDSPRGIKLSCGGTLITRRFVLTAAHCVSHLGSRLTLSSVLLGEHDVRRDPDCERIEGELHCAPSARNSSISRVIAHPGYKPPNLHDDIALVRLSEPADFTLDNMKPICLPTTRELQSQTLTGLQGLVAGWGATEEGLQSPVLLRVELPVVSNANCQAAYNGTSHIFNRQLCAGGIQDKDSCGGDSGGPLMYPGHVMTDSLRYVQHGIVSYGSKRCGVGGFPSVYTRVGHYMDWILDNLSE